jgi:MoaA/NifB/PqqE/SkfB family radical SAM enzyme
MKFTELLREVPTVLRDVYENQITKRSRVLSPTVLHVNVNLRCNTHCAMCNIWELRSPHLLTLEQFDTIFSDPVYARVEYVMLAGGEPTLRDDLPEIVTLMHRHMPRLRKVQIASNVVYTASVRAQYPRIVRYCHDHGIRLSLGVSLDGIGDTHDKIRGARGAFKKAMESVQFMKELQRATPFTMSLDPTVFSMNIGELEQLKELAERLDLPIVFQIAAISDDYYGNSGTAGSLALTEAGRTTLVKFLKRRVAEASLLDALAYYYAEAIEHAEGAPARSLPCPYADQGLLLNPDGTVQYCHNSRPIGNVLETSSTELYYSADNQAYLGTVRKESCAGCRMSCMFWVGLRKEPLTFLSFVVKRAFGVHRLHWRRRADA